MKFMFKDGNGDQASCNIDIIKNYLVISDGNGLTTDFMETIVSKFCEEHNLNANTFKVLECLTGSNSPPLYSIWTLRLPDYCEVDKDIRIISKEEFHKLINYERIK